ncbi:MAG: hypothetical protein U1F44_03850 [Coriobacteriia bacterium]|nr:hypothetical protein [Coriobacteriia bacterium]
MRRTRTLFGMFMRDDRGAIFTLTLLTWLAITSLSATAIVGGSSVAADVLNKQDIAAAADNMSGQAQLIKDKYEGSDDAYAQQMVDNAKKMDALAGNMNSDANWAIAKSAGNVAVDLALTPLQFDKLSKLGKAGKLLWDFKGGYELGQAGLDAAQGVSPDISQFQKDLAGIQFNKGKVPDPSQSPDVPNYQLDDPIEGYILGVKVDAAVDKLKVTLPDRSDELYDDLAMDVIMDMEIDKMLDSEPPSDIDFGTNPFADGLADEVQLLDPSNTPTVEMGAVQLTDEDREALESGEKDQVIGQYYSTDGMEPVVVTKDDAGGLFTEFTLLDGQPIVDTSPDFKPDYEQLPDWWDGTVDSCPYIYAYDGRTFVAVNDIISVSRDPAREYDDFMLFRSALQDDGSAEIRIVEVRNEESFLDKAVFSAIRAEPGFEAAVTPDGRVLSVRDAVAPSRAIAAAVSSLAEKDGVGVKLYDGSRFDVVFEVEDSEDAVVLVTIDGFEQLQDMGLSLFQRPTVPVEAFKDGVWQPAGVIFPREHSDDVALDVSRFVEGGAVRLRFTATSCHVGKFQLVDRVVLSSAPTDRVVVTPMEPRSAMLGGTDVSSLLADADDVRLHTVPGDTVRFIFDDPQSTIFMVESRGWYRSLNR